MKLWEILLTDSEKNATTTNMVRWKRIRTKLKKTPTCQNRQIGEAIKIKRIKKLQNNLLTATP